MAFPIQTELPAHGLELAQSEARQLKGTCGVQQTALAAGPVGADILLGLYAQLLNWQRIFTRIRGIPGLLDYAKAQFADPALDILAEFDAMLAALSTVVSAIKTTIPQDLNGFLLRDKFAPGGLEVRTFSPVETAALQSALAALAGTIG